MIAGLIRWSARNRLATIAAVLLACVAGLISMPRVPIDAIPDISDSQVIVATEYPGQPPQIVEDQVTYPLASALLGVPGARVVRGMSVQGTSFIHVVLEEGADVAAARVRVLEQIGVTANRLPAGVVPTLGPDATGVGWVYQYVLRDNKMSLAEQRSLQDWQIRYRLGATPGVAEVASVGGFVKSYSVVVDPQRLRALGISLEQVRTAIRSGNQEIGARSIEMTEREVAVQGRGYLREIADIERLVVAGDRPVPVLVRDIAHVELAADERRGVADLNGEGEVVSGIAIQRTGASTPGVVAAIKSKVAEIAGALPAGAAIQTIYDRSVLIGRAITTLRTTLIEEVLIVALICAAFLMHARSALVPILLMPAGMMIAFLPMHMFGIGANIMSLGGFAIAIGAMVDAALVMVENAHKRLDSLASGASRRDAVIAAATEVGPALFFSLLIITVSFLPILALEAEEGRLFRPLAFTKTFAMAAAALLSVTLVPAIMVWTMGDRPALARARALNDLLVRAYRPVIEVVLRFKGWVLGLAALLMLLTVWPAKQLGGEFMPTLNEGALFYMPTAQPGLSITKATELLQTQDRIIKSFPEVETVLGKAGRATTATDPAPLEMFETLIILKPERDWRPGMTTQKLIAEMDQALQMPGVANSWTMPIRARIDMLSTGIRSTLGVKVFGDDLAILDDIASRVSAAIGKVPGATSAFAERALGGRYLDIVPNRDALARYGLSIADVNATIAAAVGGDPITTTIEGRERYNVSLRYPRALRGDPQALAREVLVPLPNGKGAVTLGEVARLSISRGPASIRSEGARPVVYVYVDFQGRDLAGFVADAKKAVAQTASLPSGYSLTWSGQFEHLERAVARMALVVPLTLLAIFILLWLCFRRITEVLIVMLSMPFALVGGIWMMWLMGLHLSVATVVGFIALAGVAAETGVVMLVYIDQAYRAMLAKRQGTGETVGRADLESAIMDGAVERVRPKLMTVAAIIAGLLPILWSNGTGADVMQRIAVPMIGGMVTSTILTLLVIPAVYALVKSAPQAVRRSVQLSEAAQVTD